MLLNTARAGGVTAMLAEVPSIPRRIAITSWASERDINLLSLYRVRFESVTLIDGRDGTRRRAVSPQLSLEARRKHAPCTIPISPSWRMDCRCVWIEREEGYVRRLRELTVPNPRAPSGDVSATVISQDRPLLPLRWPPCGRKTENPEREFSQRSCITSMESSMPYTCRAFLLGRAIRGDSLKRSERSRLTVGTVFLVSWLRVEYYLVLPGIVRRFTLACLRVGISGRPHGG
jgi:hypothetical protein